MENNDYNLNDEPNLPLDHNDKYSFGLPSDYFVSFEDKLRKKLESQEELNEFPILSSIPKNNLFTMILTEQESKLLKIIRKNFEKIKQLKVKYKTGNIELIEVTTIKKVALESKIINLIKKSDYKKITIDIANGNIVNFEDTEKIKL